MADAGRRAGDPLNRLARHPERFAFFQAVRLLERNRAARVGTDTPVGEEPVRLRVVPSLAFAASPVVAAAPGEGGKPFELTVALAGLIGPAGALPQHYTALVRQRVRAKDTTLRDFLDLFHHRALALGVRAWMATRLDIGHESDGFASTGTAALAAVAGVGSAAVRGRLPVPAELPVEFAAIFGRPVPTGEGLERVLVAYFGWPARVEPFAEQWVELDGGSRAVLAGGSRPRLGATAILGRRVRDAQHKIRIVVGPLNYETFRGLLPGGPSRTAFARLARWYLGPAFDADVLLVLAAPEVPPLRLSPDERTGPRLGRNAWLASHRFAAPVTDAAFAVR